jgi:uncharacterized membrane protein
MRNITWDISSNADRIVAVLLAITIFSVLV